MKNFFFVLPLMAVACSDSESTPIETLTQIESIDYTTSAYLSGEYLIADSEIFQWDGAKTTSLGSMPDAKSVGRIGADLWACGGSKEGFFVSKRTGDLWSTPTNLGSPRPEDTTRIDIGYTYDCRVTSEGFGGICRPTEILSICSTATRCWYSSSISFS